MKKVLTLLLALCMCVGLCACGEANSKSAEAQKADELILAIGEVTADSDAAILAAQTYYDTLTDEQKAEVEHYDVLVNAQKQLPLKKIEKLMADRDFLAASALLYENPDVEGYDTLVKSCGENVVQQFIMEKGEEKESGKYFIQLVNKDGVIISLWHYTESGTVQFIYNSSGYGIVDMMINTYTPGHPEMLFARVTNNWGATVNSQEGTVDLAAYTGVATGSIVENDPEPYVITGLTVTSFETIYDKQTRGYHKGTMTNINDMLDAMFAALTDAGYKGTMSDLGFTAYQSK